MLGSSTSYSAASETARFFDSYHYRQGQILTHGEACAFLWSAVLRLAIDDLRFAREMETRRQIAPHDLERLRQIRESPPEQFLRSLWFVEICEYLGIDPRIVIERAPMTDRFRRGWSSPNPRRLESRTA